jgi:hypothetical protein
LLVFYFSEDKKLESNFHAFLIEFRKLKLKTKIELKKTKYAGWTAQKTQGPQPVESRRESRLGDRKPEPASLDCCP